MDGGKSEHAPVVDRNHYKRNKKTAWLEFLEALKAWLWAHKDGQARWTLELDEAASTRQLRRRAGKADLAPVDPEERDSPVLSGVPP